MCVYSCDSGPHDGRPGEAGLCDRRIGRVCVRRFLSGGTAGQKQKILRRPRTGSGIPWPSGLEEQRLRFQFETAEGGIDPLDYDAMVKNPAEWWAVATDVETGKPHYFTKEDVSATDYSAVMASCSIPVVCRPIEVHGRKYCDGGCSNSLPVQHALEAGCDKVIVILCRPKDSVREPEKMRFAYRTVLRNYPNLVHSIEMRHIRYNRQLRATRRLEEEGHAFIFAPHEPIHVSTYTKDPGVLQGIYDTGLKEYEEDRSRFETFLKKQLTAQVSESMRRTGQGLKHF